MDETAAFNKFKGLCAAENLIQNNFTAEGDDVSSGICDDGTLMRFLRACEFNVEDAFKRYKETREWRDANHLIELYDSIEVSDYEETRKLYTHWIGRRDRNGSPICLFEISKLTPSVMADYEKSCSSKVRQQTSTESESMLRLFCTYENLIRFILPLCSAVQPQSRTESSVTNTTSIVDMSGVSLLQLWRLKTHMQAASVLATSHYPETLGRIYIIGAPSYFQTIWAWISKWFNQNTISKIRIVPNGKECSALSETIDPADIPCKYGGQCRFKFGMDPDLDLELKEKVEWLHGDDGKVIQELPKGPLRWVKREDEKRTAIAVGTVDALPRRRAVIALHS